MWCCLSTHLTISTFLLLSGVRMWLGGNDRVTGEQSGTSQVRYLLAEWSDPGQSSWRYHFRLPRQHPVTSVFIVRFGTAAEPAYSPKVKTVSVNKKSAPCRGRKKCVCFVIGKMKRCHQLSAAVNTKEYFTTVFVTVDLTILP